MCCLQDVILMSDSCDVCGYKSSEIKGGGAIADLGRAITLRVSEQEDLRRDVIKADSATVRMLSSAPDLAPNLRAMLPRLTGRQLCLSVGTLINR
jgi:zinc finger protein